MLETIAIAALVVGGLSGAAVVTQHETEAEQGGKPAVVEVQQADTLHRQTANSPFMD